MLGLFTACLLFGCGGGNQESSSEDQSTESATETESSSGTPAVTPVDNPEAKSESKGVGRFSSTEIGPLDKGMAQKGEAIFTTKCASCHKLTEEKLVGPGLKGVTERRTPEWILNMITNPDQMTKEDPVAKALFEKHLIQMTFQNVSDDEARQILEFLRQNDGSK